MADEPRFEVRDNSLNDPEGDKTPKNDNVDPLDGIPSEDEDADKEPSALDKRGKSKKEENPESDDKDKKVDRSDIAQKIKYREKYREAQDEIKRLKDQLADPNRTPQEKAADEKQIAAKKYLQETIRAELTALEREKKEREKQEIENFETEVDEVLDDNPDLTRKDLLNAIEEYDVSPKTAAKILQKHGSAGGSKREKPKMPAPKGGGGGPVKKPVDDSKKSMHDIARDLAKEAKEQGVF